MSPICCRKPHARPAHPPPVSPAPGPSYPCRPPHGHPHPCGTPSRPPKSCHSPAAGNTETAAPGTPLPRNGHRQKAAPFPVSSSPALPQLHPLKSFSIPYPASAAHPRPSAPQCLLNLLLQRPLRPFLRRRDMRLSGNTPAAPLRMAELQQMRQLVPVSGMHYQLNGA